MTAKDESHERFTERLREAMDAQGLDQRGLAVALGVDEASVSRWFNKGHMPKARTLAQMPVVLGGASLDWLLGVPRALPPTAMRQAINDAAARARASTLAEIRAALLRSLDALEAKAPRADKRSG